MENVSVWWESGLHKIREYEQKKLVQSLNKSTKFHPYICKTKAFPQFAKFFKSMEDKTMKLIYRAHIYDYTPRPVQPYIKPRAINWRYQLP